MLYCFGGATNETFDAIHETTNSHIALNLKLYNGFNDFNSSMVTWNKVSFKITSGTTLINLPSLALGASTNVKSDNSYIIYGGYINNDNKSNPYPFIKYQPRSNQWIALPSPVNYTADGTIVDLGNGNLWAWGGLDYVNNGSSSGAFNIFNYNNFTWNQPLTSNMPLSRYGHTATLDTKGIIYIIGGYVPTLNAIAEIKDIITFNSATLQWNSIHAIVNENKKIYNRTHHTTTLIPDSDLLVLYGGMIILDGERFYLSDVYYIFDTKKNIFTSASLPDRSIKNYRYGHYATIYNKHLLLIFGNNEEINNSFAESISALYIGDPYNPTWINNKNKMSYGEIAAVAVSIVFGISAIIGLFFYIRHRKRRQNKAFILEQEDPRRHQFDNQYEFNNTSQLIKPFDTGENEKYNSIKPSDSEVNNFSSVLSDTNETNVQTLITRSTTNNTLT
ncbi:unnamed protein product [Cunninghamella echinulata]